MAKNAITSRAQEERECISFKSEALRTHPYFLERWHWRRGFHWIRISFQSRSSEYQKYRLSEDESEVWRQEQHGSRPLKMETRDSYAGSLIRRNQPTNEAAQGREREKLKNAQGKSSRVAFVKQQNAGRKWRTRAYLRRKQLTQGRTQISLSITQKNNSRTICKAWTRTEVKRCSCKAS